MRADPLPNKTAAKEGIIPLEIVEQRIFALHGRRVMLDRDLAELYGVETRVLNQAVKRNNERFPEDFMFRLSLKEAQAVRLSRSQTVTLKRGSNIKYRPHVFTEHGAVMLANVLQSPAAVRAVFRWYARSYTCGRCSRPMKIWRGKLKLWSARWGSTTPV